MKAQASARYSGGKRKARSRDAAGISRAGVRAPHKKTGALFLVGFMGAGKSSVGHALAKRLGWAFEDLDDRIVQREGRSVADIFSESGEAEFRRAERDALEQVIAELAGGEARVIALGGGAFVQKDNAARLKASGIPTVFLNAPVEELWKRCRKQSEESGNARPLLASMEKFRALHESRLTSYAKASVKVETGGCGVDAVVEKIVESLGLRISGK